MKNHETQRLDRDLAEEAAAQEHHGEYTEGAPEYVPSEFSQEKQPRKRKKRKKKRYLLKILLLVLICAGIYFLLRSDLFNIKTIQVSQSSHFTAEQVQEMAGLKKGVNLFDFKAGQCEDKLEENPYIKEAKVKRKLPGTVSVEIVERQELAVLIRDKDYVIIDREGVVLQITQEAPRLTLLSGLTVTGAEENETVVVGEDGVFKRAMKMLKAMQDGDLFFKQINASQVVVSAYVTDTLICKGKLKNLIASMEEGNLQAVLYDLYKRGIKKGVVNIGDDQTFSYSKKIE